MKQYDLINNHLSRFPDLPEYEAIWAPIYWEPVMLSGERLCAIIAANGLNGEVLVEPVLRRDVLKLLYPGQETHALDLINWASNSVREHLLAAHDLSEWASPISGFSLGRISSSCADDITGIIQQAIPLCSSLAQFDASQRTTSPRRAVAMSQEVWKAAIKSEVITKIPSLDKGFDRSFNVVNGARSTLIDFVGYKLVCNFSRLVSTRLSRSLKDAKSQALDLATLRDREDLFPINEKYKLLVWKPDHNAPFDLSEAQLQSVEEAFLELKWEGDRVGLSVCAYTEPQIAARDICQIEKAG